ncbi:MFS transporter [Streptomyces sp. NPDC017868]|uniref:MFS transporter n=1 Tax=Streptomyces sp. NPDC017868 TaxID=3365014 RepID=UPI0037A7BE45
MTTSATARAFASLRVRNFRLFVIGQIVSAMGTWMMVVAQDWLVLGMTGDSGTALSTVTALQFAPVLLLTLYGGRLADRFDKRRLLTVANLVSGVLALVLGTLVLTGAVRLWSVYGFALALGLVNAVEIPARMSFVGELVGAELLPNASALSAAYFNVARIVGPAGAGLLIGFLGTGWVMLVNGVSYLATVVALRLMDPTRLRGAAPGRDRARVGDGLRYVARRPDVLVPLALVAAVAVFGMNFQLTLPLLAKTVFHSDAATFGLVTAAFATGSLVAAFAGTLRRDRPAQRLVIVSAAAFGVAEAAVGWAPTYGTAAALLFVTGLTTTHFAQAANHRIQLGSDPRYRGRVLGLYTLILQGSTPLGALLMGRVAEHAGARATFVAGGLCSLVAALVAVTAGRRGAEASPPLAEPEADSAHRDDETRSADLRPQR